MLILSLSLNFNWCCKKTRGPIKMISSGINLVMTVIGFAVSTMFIVFVCTRLICARIQLNASRRSFPVASRSDLSILERGLRGLEPVVVSNFPTKKYCKELFLASEDAQCTVCLAEYSGEDMLRILPHCGHSFHVTCIDLWLQQHSTCPVCRISLRESPDRKRVMQPSFSSALRTQYGTESCENGHASRARRDSLGTDTIRENHCVTDGSGVEGGEENVSSQTMDDHTVKSPSTP